MYVCCTYAYSSLSHKMRKMFRTQINVQYNSFAHLTPACLSYSVSAVNSTSQYPPPPPPPSLLFNCNYPLHGRVGRSVGRSVGRPVGTVTHPSLVTTPTPRPLLYNERQQDSLPFSQLIGYHFSVFSTCVTRTHRAISNPAVGRDGGR